jgi:adenylate cyclase
MIRTSSHAAVMFADIAGSTGLYESLGDEKARALTGDAVAAMTKITRQMGGEVVKTIGDEIMARFPTAEMGIIAACAIQESMERRKQEGVPIRVRIGVHWGPVLTESGDLFGGTVNIAARMVALANARQIVTTGETVAMLTGPLLRKARAYDRTQVKGIHAEVVAYQVIWEEEEVVTTLAPTQLSALDFARGPLELRCGDKLLAMRLEDDPLVIGRAETCSFPVPSNFASRQHARIESRRGRFNLVDQSTNGTWVRFGDSPPVLLRREELPLTGAGVISLGEEVRDGNPALVHFLLRS